MTAKPLSQMKKGDKGKIATIEGGGRIRRRLLDMGLVSGSTVEVQRVAPLGDPVEVRIKGYNLSLRRNEADSIQVEVQ